MNFFVIFDGKTEGKMSFSIKKNDYWILFCIFAANYLITMKHKFIYILFLAYICGCGFKQDIERQPVIVTISRISCSCSEDTLLDRNSMDDIRQIFFCIDVVNPNDMDIVYTCPFRV